MINEICKICGREIRKTSMSRHLNHTYNITLKEYYDQFYKKEGEGICLFCGKESVFNGLNGYRQYCSKYCNNHSPIRTEKMVNTYNKKSAKEKEEIVKNIKRTKFDRYGNENYTNPEKMLKTKEERNSFAIGGEKLSEIYKNKDEVFFENRTKKMKETKLEKYGDENFVNKEKAEQTCLEKYGVDNVFKLDSMQQKAKEVKKEKYGDEFYSNKEKRKQTNLSRFGVENPFNNEEISNKIKNTNLERYGVYSFSKTEEFKNIIVEYQREEVEKYLKEICANNNLELLEFDSYEVKFVCLKCNEEFIIKKQQLYLRVRNDKIVCLYCNPLYQYSETSEDEKQIFEFVKENYHNTIKENDRTVLKLELDVYLPEDFLAFEFNGLYWHSSDHKKHFYHKHKTDLCEKQNIHLIHIYEDDWMFKPDIVESNILKLLKVSPILYPNNYIVKEISSSISKDFLESNSLQFDKDFDKSFGLFSNNTLVYVLTLNKNKINNIQEISKYTVKDAFQIIFNYLKENLQYDSYKLILDRSWYKTQESFEGFKFNKYIKEKSFFIINNKREDSIKDEKDNERILKIYNSGFLQYIWKKSGGNNDA